MGGLDRAADEDAVEGAEGAPGREGRHGPAADGRESHLCRLLEAMSAGGLVGELRSLDVDGCELALDREATIIGAFLHRHATAGTRVRMRAARLDESADPVGRRFDPVEPAEELRWQEAQDAEFDPVVSEMPGDLASAEKAMIAAALRQNEGNRKRAAEQLALWRSWAGAPPRPAGAS